MQNQERILSIIDVRGRKFDIPVDRIIEANNAFLDKAMVVEEESTWHNPVCRPPDNPEGVETMAHVLLNGTFDIPASIIAGGRQLEYLVHVAGVGDEYAVASMAERAYYLFTQQLHLCTSSDHFIAAVRTIYAYPRSSIDGQDMISAMKRVVVYFLEARVDVTWIVYARALLFTEVGGFEADYRDARKNAAIA
ncbi:uncharacterized protein LTHEOB_8452 [Lasiodiplodia theobromae]|uniref:uncharacterized protein n=1 Tax=Lasiodiplodia theobromae TaxID=45133 RepID=UPI0015C37381|nr:uncharacterized protein LTHEOB_8452 [Lasiodiplodia theobromae]KAF4541457.1 hypothetical protein LTHEOB_8452 [Lasiodiplodia theobromae]